MNVETLIWTLILFGGTVLVVIWLCSVAWRKEAAHLHNGDDLEESAPHE